VAENKKGMVWSMIEKGSLILSPLFKYTRYPFRVLATEYGAGVTITEMVSIKSFLAHFSKKFNLNTYRLIYTDSKEKNVGIQIFGNEPKEFEEVGSEIEDKTKFKFININLGCSKKKISQQNMGAALLRYPELVEKLVNSLSKGTNLPITLKVRIGWNRNVLPEIVKIAEEYSNPWIIIHTRYATETFATPAHLEVINEISNKTDLPIIANGDVFSFEDIEEYMKRGAYAVAIGRWAKGRPYIFMGKENASWEEKVELLDKFIEYTIRMYKDCDEITTDLELIKRFALDLTKNEPGGREIRRELIACKSVNNLKNYFITEI